MKRKINLETHAGKPVAALITCVLITSIVLAGAARIALAQTVIKTIPVGAGPWDVALNPVTNKIDVANGNGSSVSVIDGATLCR